MNIQTIEESFINGQFKQMKSQIEEYGLCKFWRDYLNNAYYSDGMSDGFRNAVNISRIYDNLEAE